jgi:hypothetical protein
MVLGGKGFDVDLPDIDIDLIPDVEDLKDVLDSVTPKIEDFGVQVVKAIENAFGYVREQVRGKEPDIIASITAGSLVILAVVMMYNQAKKGF